MERRLNQSWKLIAENPAIAIKHGVLGLAPFHPPVGFHGVAEDSVLYRINRSIVPAPINQEQVTVTVRKVRATIL